MYIPRESNIYDQIGATAHIFLITESGEAIGEVNLMRDCLKQIKMDRSLTTAMKAKLSNTLRNRKKAVRNRFVKFVG